MPRTGALLPLSREHHTALVLARAARRAVESCNEAACLAVIERIEAHWQMVMAAHFANEEQLMRLAGELIDPVSVKRIFSEHTELKLLASGSCAFDSIERLNRFSELIVNHVRYEERELFPLLQQHSTIANIDS